MAAIAIGIDVAALLAGEISRRSEDIAGAMTSRCTLKSHSSTWFNNKE
jgi:hypothetical protein